MTDTFHHVVEIITYVLEGVGVAVIIGGFLTATLVYLVNYSRLTTHEAYLAFRKRSVRGLILGLEFLVAADIIKTITVAYSLESVMMLAMVILVRTFLVFALHLEIEGHFPWSRARADAPEHVD